MTLNKDNDFMQSKEVAVISCLHESLINALVHCDYHGDGGIVIEKEKDLFRFQTLDFFVCR